MGVGSNTPGALQVREEAQLGFVPYLEELQTHQSHFSWKCTVQIRNNLEGRLFCADVC